VRDYGVGAQILRDLGVRRLRLLTNNPAKYHAMRGYGLEIAERVALQVPSQPHNEGYLRTKRDKLGHRLERLGAPPAPAAPGAGSRPEAGPEAGPGETPPGSGGGGTPDAPGGGRAGVGE
jgi:hypothetical protein